MKNQQQIYDAIHEIVRLIPEGRVTNYGAIAKAIGLRSGARMVARAMAHSPNDGAPFPAQRVVNSTGELSGDNGSRKALLEAEGLQIHQNKVVNFKQVFWDPLIEI